MSYYKDLSAYEYELPVSLPSVLTVGWLEVGQSYCRGSVERSFMDSLEWCCCCRFTHQMRGSHHCDMCGATAVVINCVGSQRKLGSAEIWIPGENGVIYAAPDLILHYVMEHGYCPPFQFISAVERLYSSREKIENIYEEVVGRALRSLGY